MWRLSDGSALGNSPPLHVRDYSVTGGDHRDDGQKVAPVVRKVDVFHGTGKVSPRVSIAIDHPSPFRGRPV